MTTRGTYTRWTSDPDGHLHADLLGTPIQITAHPDTGHVAITTYGNTLTGLVTTPDEARLYGVRLIEAAALADGDRSVRHTIADDPAPAATGAGSPTTDTPAPG